MLKKILVICYTFNKNRPVGDPSVWYRVVNLAKKLRETNIQVEYVSEWDLPELTIDFSKYHLALFFRPRGTCETHRVIEQFRRHGIPYVASYDDLLFDVSTYQISSTAKAGASKKLMLERYRDWANGFDLFDCFLVTTEALKNEIKSLKVKSHVSIVDNFLPSDYIDYINLLWQQKSSRVGNYIGYFAGGKSHLNDFLSIEADLLSFCRDTNYRVLLPNNLKVEVQSELADYCSGFDRLSYPELFKAYLIPKVCLAPLILDRNAACKSSIKFLEAALLGCPLVATGLKSFNKYKPNNLLSIAPEKSDWSLLLKCAIDLSESNTCQGRSEALDVMLQDSQNSLSAFVADYS